MISVCYCQATFSLMEIQHHITMSLLVQRQRSFGSKKIEKTFFVFCSWYDVRHIRHKAKCLQHAKSWNVNYCEININTLYAILYDDVV